jgi:hypothetical protein
MTGSASVLLQVLFGFGIFAALGYAASLIPQTALRAFAIFVVVLVCVGWCLNVIPAIPLPSPLILFK